MPIRQNLSAIARQGRNLFLACDEGASVERLTRTSPGRYERHQRFDLAPLLDLPFTEPEDNEVDIEGLDVSGGYLWLTGSHSLKRKKPKGQSPAKDIERLASVNADGNRFTLARIPLAEDNAGDHTLVARSGKLRAERLDGDERGNLLVDALRDDAHIGPFVPRPVKPGSKTSIIGIPSKENGLDIEGLAVFDSRVFLGMRGPVLSGWAVVLELRVSSSVSAGVLELKPKNGALYRKHFLQLDGLGVRELTFDGEDLLVLAGPTMDLDGPVAVYRWPGALGSKGDTLNPRAGLQRVLDVPFGVASDHAEGIMVVSEPGATPTEVCLVFDSPAKSRLVDQFGVRADVFALATADLGAQAKAERSNA